jgi:hypothetical protein
MSDLSDFFKLIAEDKKKQKEEFNSIVGDLNIDSIFDEFSSLKKKDKENIKREEKTLEAFENWIYSETSEQKEKVIEDIIEDSLEEVLEVLEDNKEELEEFNKVEESTLIEKSLGLLAEPSDIKQQNDPLTPLDQKFATLDDLQKHYSTFLTRIQQQLSTLGGGGETRLEFLDDVDRDSVKTDNYFLKYDATINKWVGDPADGAGITSIVSISGVTTYYQASNVDDYIGVSADVPVVIVLPQIPSYGKKLIVKDEGNKIATYNITVQAGAGTSVENDTSVLMKINHQSFTYFYNGSNWFLI